MTSQPVVNRSLSSQGRWWPAVIAAAAGALPGVEQTDVRITGRRAHPLTRVRLTLTAQAAPGTVLDARCEGPLRTARRCTGSSRVPTEVRP
ncbi:hypothetical protein [Streptomyces hyaluromycini]|uniref:hypothetical protein n=1 Tax=Streptomyces hyaluromycini TaxID=1377993 RepID=UPI000B5CEFE9|nr:hypothetical protein [Streptomyces hyaluromycini]